MDTKQIYSILKKHLGKHFLGVFSSDQVPPYIPQLPCAIVCNTDPHFESGEHWVAIFISSDGYGEYFDSYGREPMKKTFECFLERNSLHWTYNPARLQSDYSIVCGHYSIFYILHRYVGYTLNEIINMFSNDYMFNDDIILDYIENNFNIKIDSDDWLINQLCKSLCKIMN